MAAGDIAGCGTAYKDDATAALIQQQPAALVFALGDLAYPDGTVAEFACYHASWGGFKGRTYPIMGNHEYHQLNAKPYFDYWNGGGVDSGRAGHRARGYYAFDYGAWRIIVLNSHLNLSPQATWLRAELAANPRQCTLAYWHRPFYSSNNGTTLSPNIQEWWKALLAAKVEIVLGGSHHYYERFAPQNATAGATAGGIRQFVVGTGGAGVGTGDITPRLNSQKLIIRTHGVLQLTLAPGHYSYGFQAISGAILDAGEASCDGGAIPLPSVTKINLRVSGREDATTQYMELDWTGADGPSLDVFRNGTRITVTPNDGHYTNSRSTQGSITYVYKVCEAGTALCSNEATVTFGTPPNVPPAARFTWTCDGSTCTFSDQSSDADGTVTAWRWSFGDGATATTQDPSHTYTGPGPFEITLVATDDKGATGTAIQTLTLTPPPANAPPVAGFSSSCAGLTCTFTDLSTDSDGSVTGWGWTFGEGDAAATTRNSSHTYAAEGSYEITLVATDDDGAADTTTQTVIIGPPPANVPPAAGFSASCAGLTCTFTDLSTDSDGSVTGWSWTFGEVDGAPATARNPSHTYATEGPYEVILVATDDGGETSTSTQTVTVTPPPPNAPPAAGFSSSCAGLTCTFTDLSTDSDGSVTGWSWTFGDGDGATATVRNPSHTYATEGPYEVILVATDDGGETGTSTQTVTVTPPPPNAPPAAGFSASCAGLTCTFTDQTTDSDGSVTGWSWTFGDGSAATVRNPTHTYAAGGPFEITLMATDDGGETGTSTQTVTVTAPPPNAPPVAGFTASCVQLTCTFTDQSTDSDGSVTGWRWTFGNGSSATVRNPTHTYAAGGSFEVTLIATDDGGKTGTSTQTVTTTAPPPNAPPAADFSSSCVQLTCTFTDRSTDSDGSVTGWSWTFGDGSTATTRNPSRTYAANGSYSVTLVATDNAQRTGTVTKQVTVARTAIVLTVTGRKDATTHYMTLKWTGARGAGVDVYRNNAFRTNTPNDGHYVNTRSFTSAATYAYKVCETGTTVCSNVATVTF